jgi:hypothetical protein
MTPDGLRAQYLIPNLSPSANAYTSIRPFRSGHVTTQSRKISANSPFAERKQTADRKLFCRILLKKPSFFWTDFFIKLGPQIRLLPVPNFGVNTCPFNYGIKSDFIPKLTPIANVSRLNLFNTYSLSSQSVRASIQIQTLGHLFPKLKSPMAGQNQAAQVNFISVSFIRHYLFDFLPQISPSAFLRQELSTFQVSRDMHHDLRPRSLFTSPINKTVGTPSSLPSLLAFKSLPASSFLPPITSAAPKTMAGSNNRHRVADEAEGSRAGAHRRQ